MLARTLGARLAPRLGASRNLSTASLQHVKLDVTESGVAMLRLDCQGEKQNTLSRELMDEMEVVVKQVVQKDHKDQVTLLQQLPLKETMVDLDLEEDNFLI